jgi:hypothetical protein
MNEKMREVTEERYENYEKEIADLLVSVKKGLEKHAKETQLEGSNWSRVGDLVRFKERLKEIDDALFSKGEFTPEEE